MCKEHWLQGRGNVCVSTQLVHNYANTHVHVAGAGPECLSAARPHSLSLTLSL